MYRKWNWAGHAARWGVKTWVWRTTAWRDTAWEDAVLGPKPVRSRTDPWMRWENDVSSFCKQNGVGEWKRAARDRETWFELNSNFVQSEL